MRSRVLIVSFVLTLLIGLLLEKTIGFRVSREEELEGIDGVEHAESGYDLNPLGSIGRRGHVRQLPPGRRG